MKYKKFIANYFAQRANTNVQVGIALVAGLAAGAVISILFAPDSGANTRKNISDQAKNVGDGIKDSYGSLRDRIAGKYTSKEAIAEAEVPHFTHQTVKKRKSAIKELIHESHQEQEGSQG